MILKPILKSIVFSYFCIEIKILIYAPVLHAGHHDKRVHAPGRGIQTLYQSTPPRGRKRNFPYRRERRFLPMRDYPGTTETL